MLKALSPINGSDKNFDFFFWWGGGGRRHKYAIIYILMGFSQSTINAVIINWLRIETALINGRKFTFKIHVQTL